MSLIFLWSALALAADPQVAEPRPEPPVAALVALGLDIPSPGRDDGWRAALPGGGLVRWVVTDDEAAATATFEGFQRTAQSGAWPELPPEGLNADQAVGDGAHSVLVRQGLVVLYVRDLSGDAAAWARRLLPLLTAER